MNKSLLIDIINDTLNKCENEYSWMLDDAINIFYSENYFINLRGIKQNDYKNNLHISFLEIALLVLRIINLSNIKTKKVSNIKLVKETTVEALQNYGTNTTYSVLNFASAKHPGGGVLKGTIAQEEALARVSSLYPIIKKCTNFYENPISPYYTDKIIYSKPIYVFKNDHGQEIEPIKCEVITCAAPNYSFSNINLVEHKKVMTKRFTKVLMSAIANNQRNLLLGAWGCGVFKNPPDINAQIFRDVIDQYSEYFDDIIFAIPDDRNYQIFKENLY